MRLRAIALVSVGAFNRKEPKPLSKDKPLRIRNSTAEFSTG
jgi:hypothetical protein